MSKYGSGLTVSDICKLEVNKARTILASHNVNESDINLILNMIKEAYFQLNQANASNRALESLMEKKHVGYSLNDYMACFLKETQRFPFEDDEKTSSLSPDRGTDDSDEYDEEEEYDDDEDPDDDLALLHDAEEEEYDCDDYEDCDINDLMAELDDSVNDVMRYVCAIQEKIKQDAEAVSETKENS